MGIAHSINYPERVQRSDARRPALSTTPNFLVLQRPVKSAQQAAASYRALLRASGITGSMSQRRNPYDNANAESFMKTLKIEAVYPMAFETFEDVATTVRDSSTASTINADYIPPWAI